MARARILAGSGLRPGNSFPRVIPRKKAGCPPGEFRGAGELCLNPARAASQQGGDLLFTLVFKDTVVLFFIHTRVRAHMWGWERRERGSPGRSGRERRENQDPTKSATSLSRHLERLTNFSPVTGAKP